MNVAFQKNQNLSLSELGGSSPILVVGIGWESKVKDGIFNQLLKKKHDADLDLSCVMYDANNDRIDCIWYAQLNSKCGAVRHKGDDTVGWDQGDDETIIIDLHQLNEQAHTLFFVISSFGGESFSQVENAYWRLFDGQSKRPLANYKLQSGDKTSAKIVMRLQKSETPNGYEWRVKALDEAATGQNIQEIFPEIRSLIEG